MPNNNLNNMTSDVKPIDDKTLRGVYLEALRIEDRKQNLVLYPRHLAFPLQLSENRFRIALPLGRIFWNLIYDFIADNELISAMERFSVSVGRFEFTSSQDQADELGKQFLAFLDSLEKESGVRFLVN